MALVERTRGEEILIRLNVNGISGAHYQTITEILRDGLVISATLNAPIPLSLVDETGTSLSALLGETASSALTQLEQANAQIQFLTESLAIANESNKQLNAKIAELISNGSVIIEVPSEDATEQATAG